MEWKTINNFELERFVHQGLPSKREKAIQKQLKYDIQLTEEIKGIKESNQDFANKYPADLMVPKIIERYHNQSKIIEEIRPPRRVLIPWLVAVPIVASILVMLLILFPPAGFNKPSDTSHDIILKGEREIDFTQPQLLIHRKKNSDIEVLQNGAKGKAGDLLQLAYIPADQLHGVILSIDGNGKITLHFPLEGSNSTTLVEDKYFIPEAIELDNAPEFERFFFITSNSEIDIDNILIAAKNLANDPNAAKQAKIELPKGFKQISINIIKER